MLRAWHDKITYYLVTIDFHMENVGHSLYVRRIEIGIEVIIIFLNDLIAVRESDVEVEHAKGLLKPKFEMNDLGELRYSLGIEIIKMLKDIWLS